MNTRRAKLLLGTVTALFAATTAATVATASTDTTSPTETTAAVATTSGDDATATTSGDATATTAAESETTAAGSATTDAAAPSTTANPNVHLEDDEDAGEPVRGGTLRLMMRLDADQLDPAVSTDTSGVIVGALVYEGLVSQFRGEIQPSLAESWEISDDGLEYTFTLREGAMFHSGRAVTADDVVYSLERVMNPDTLSPNINSYEPIESVTASDERTVVITLKKPHAPLLFLLASLSASVVDQDVVDSGGVVAPPDGGTGPFVLSEHNVGRNIMLTAFEDYWDPELPYLDAIDITWNPDDNARAAAIRSHSVDVLSRPAPEFLQSLKDDPNIKWYGGSGSLSLHLLMNSSVEPFNDERVRQAIFYALDRQTILDIANSGEGLPLNGGYLPPDRWGGLTEPIYGAPDLDKARALLAEAGYPDGFDTTLTVIATSAFQVRQAEVEKEMLAEIGINVTINPVEAQVATDMTRAGDFEMYQSGFGLRADPDERLTAAFSTGGGLNYANWSDPEFDALLEEARGELDQDRRAELYQQADTILATRGPAAFTILTADYDVVWKNVNGYRADPTPGFGIYKYLWMSEDS